MPKSDPRFVTVQRKIYDFFSLGSFRSVGGEAPDPSNTKGTKSPLCMLASNHNSMLIAGRQDSLEYWLPDQRLSGISPVLD